MKSSFLGLIMAACLAVPASAQNIPTWLQRHVGFHDGQIAPVVLERARAHYQKQVRRGKVSNPCYMAMDATRPSMTGDTPSKRYYIICEQTGTFQAMSSGYGSGRKIPAANFRNGRQCAQHFSNAEGSNLTSGGSYITSEVRTSFKGYYRQEGQLKAFHRPFLAFDGIGDNRNARDRFIGGHQAMFHRFQCRLKAPNAKYADDEGYVRFGKLVNYSAGRSNGCTTWDASGSKAVLSRAENNPTTLYIYPEADDIAAVRAGGGYWDRSCLAAIGKPMFWPKRQLEPVIKAWRASLPKSEARELPICE